MERRCCCEKCTIKRVASLPPGEQDEEAFGSWLAWIGFNHTKDLICFAQMDELQKRLLENAFMAGSCVAEGVQKRYARMHRRAILGIKEEVNHG